MENSSAQPCPVTLQTRSSDLFMSPLLHIFIIICATLLVYSNTLQVPFVLDDFIYVTNGSPQAPLLSIFDSAELMRSTDLPDGGKLGLLNRRVGFMTFALNYRLHGLTVTGYHLTNISIHALAAILVYLLIVRCWQTPFMVSCFTSDEAYRERLSRLMALAAAALFAVHPVQTQAVTYIVQRFASLATLLYLLALYAYLTAALRRERLSAVACYSAALIAAILAMFTKEISFTLPIIMLLADLLLLRRPLRSTAAAIIPFLLTMAIIPYNLLKAKHLVAAAASLHDSMTLLAGKATLSRHDYFVTELRVIVTYIRLLLFPVDQNLDYDYPEFTSIFTPQVFLSVLLLATLAAAALYLLRKSTKNCSPSSAMQRLIAFGICWFFITLSVESSIQPIESVIYEHRLYLPSFGFLLAAVSTIALLWHRLSLKFALPRMTMPIIATLLITGFAITAHARNRVWQDDIGLWQDVVRKSPAKARAHFSLADVYLEKSRLDDAAVQFSRAIELMPGKPDAKIEAYYNLGQISEMKRQPEAAIGYYQTALALDPKFTAAAIGLGRIYQDQGLLQKAMAAYQAALQRKGDLFEAHYNLGIVYNSLGNYDKAINEYQQAETLKANYAPLYNNLAVTYATLGRFDLALTALNKALQIDPTYTKARANMQLISGKRHSQQTRQ